MPMKDETKALRNLLGLNPDGVKCCGVCGKPGAKSTKQLNEASPAHKAAIDQNLPAQYRMLEKAIGGNILEFTTKARFNAQLESIREKLAKAREEHDKYSPEVKATSDRKSLIATLTQTLDMLGVKVQPNPAEDSKGEWSPLELADAVQITIGQLMSDEGVALVASEDTNKARMLAKLGAIGTHMEPVVPHGAGAGAASGNGGVSVEGSSNLTAEGINAALGVQVVTMGAASKPGLCEACTEEGHDTCPMNTNCQCCSDTLAEMVKRS